jgi:hypothetical protein
MIIHFWDNPSRDTKFHFYYQISNLGPDSPEHFDKTSFVTPENDKTSFVAPLDKINFVGPISTQIPFLQRDPKSEFRVPCILNR